MYTSFQFDASLNVCKLSKYSLNSFLSELLGSFAFNFILETAKFKYSSISARSFSIFALLAFPNIPLSPVKVTIATPC